MSRTKKDSFSQVKWWLLIAIPALLTGFLIFQNGVDIPYWDQWFGNCRLFEKMSSGQLGIGDFFAQHSEHRLFFPRLVMHFLALLTHWNVRWELFLIWMLAWMILGNLTILARKTHISLAGPNTYLLLLASSVLLFSPLQWETWLMGDQICCLMLVAVFTTILWTATRPSVPASFLSTILLCAVNTFSFASGSAEWLLCAPLLMLPGGRFIWRDRLGWWLLWVTSAAGSIFLYFHNYHRQIRHPDPFLIFSHPIAALSYCLAYLGSPFAMGTTLNSVLLSNIAGGLLMLGFSGILVFLWKQRANAELIQKFLPWLTLCSFAIANAALASVGRLGFGIGQALSSRYVTFSVLLPIGLLFLAAGTLEFYRENPPKGILLIRRAFPCLITAFALMHTIGSLGCLQTWRDLKRSRLLLKAVVQSVNVVDEPELLAGCVHPDTETLKGRINVLDKLGYLRPPLIRSKDLREITEELDSAGMDAGALQQAGNTADGRLVVAGWAFLPDKRRPADAVMLAYDAVGGQPIIFALGPVGSARADISKSHNDPDYLPTGWQKAFDPKLLPPNAKVIRAYAYDSEKGKAYPLSGVCSLNR